MPRNNESDELNPKVVLAKVDKSMLDLTSVEVQYRGRYGPGLWGRDPAQFSFTGLGNQRFGKLCLDSGLGTDRPTTLLAVPDETRTKLYLIPGVEHPAAVEVTYHRNLPRFNLVKLFTKMKRILPKGSHEFYPVKVAEEWVEVDGKEYRALEMPLKRTKTRWTKSETKKVEARAKAATKRSARASKNVARTQEPEGPIPQAE